MFELEGRLLERSLAPLAPAASDDEAAWRRAAGASDSGASMPRENLWLSIAATPDGVRCAYGVHGGGRGGKGSGGTAGGAGGRGRAYKSIELSLTQSSMETRSLR